MTVFALILAAACAAMAGLTGYYRAWDWTLLLLVLGTVCAVLGWPRK